MSLRRVRKRDGREVAFDKAQIAAAVVSAQNAVGQHDPMFARDVADLVELALRRRYAWRGAEGSGEDPSSGLFEGEADETTSVESVPGIEEIQDLVEVGLVELGRAAVAKAYILYRDRRARSRQSFVRSASAEPGEGQPAGVRVREAQGTFPWSKGRVAAALVHEADLSREQAQQVAARVELRVVSSGLKRLSTGLIREFVDNELVSMGLSSALARQAPVAVPRHDLRELLERGSDSPVSRRGRLGRRGAVGAEQALGGDVLRRYALDDLFDEQTVELHLSGALHIEDLRAPHLYLTQALSCEFLQRGEPSGEAAFDALGEVANMLSAVSRGLVLEAPGALLAPLTRSTRGLSLGSWLHALAALSVGTGKRIDLAGFGAKGAPLLAKLVPELELLSQSESSAGLPRLFVDGKDLRGLRSPGSELEQTLEHLLAEGILVPTWAVPGERFVGPAGRRRARESGGLACGGAVAINLARLGRQAGPWREDLVLEGIAHLVEDALVALERLASFQRSARAVRPGEVRGRVAYSLVPVGLREALGHLGDGEVRAEQGSRLLGLLSDATRRFAVQRGLSVHLSSHHGLAASLRFALVEGTEQVESQGLLFDSQEHSVGLQPLTVGYDLGAHPGQPAGEAEAQLLATVPAGSWPAADLGRRLQRAEGSPLMAAWERFEEQREGLRSRVLIPAEPSRMTLFSPVDGEAAGSSSSVV